MTKKQAEAHLAKFARRRARYAERKKQQEKPLISIVSGVASWDDEIDLRPAPVVAAVQHALVFTDEFAGRQPEVIAAFETASAPTPRPPEQLTLPLETRIAQLRPMTPEARREIDQEARNVGRAWIAQILAGMEDA